MPSGSNRPNADDVAKMQEAYDYAIEFIRLADHMRMFTAMGGVPTAAMMIAINEVQDRYDAARRQSLWAQNRQRWTSDWMRAYNNAVVLPVVAA